MNNNEIKAVISRLSRIAESLEKPSPSQRAAEWTAEMNVLRFLGAFRNPKTQEVRFVLQSSIQKSLDAWVVIKTIGELSSFKVGDFAPRDDGSLWSVKVWKGNIDKAVSHWNTRNTIMTKTSLVRAMKAPNMDAVVKGLENILVVHGMLTNTGTMLLDTKSLVDATTFAEQSEVFARRFDGTSKGSKK